MIATGGVFDRVLCGVDGSPAGVLAARAAAAVSAPDAPLLLVAVDDPSPAVHAGWGMTHVLRELEQEAAQALERARVAVEPLRRVETRFLKGSAVPALLGEIERERATLVAVGSHGRSRGGGIVLGGVSTRLLHEAPCAVLVARGHVGPDWPRRIVVGVDGSSDSGRALAAAQDLGARLGAAVRAVVATEDAHVDVERAAELAPGVEEHAGRALDVLNVASETADLVVVGSRGLKGVRALGSLSERLAHEARCSVLVLRPPPAP